MGLIKDLTTKLKILRNKEAVSEEDYSKESDDSLMNKWVTSNDMKAYEEIYNRYSEKVSKFLSNKVSRELAEDAMQECFKTLIERREKLKTSNSSLKNLFFTISYNYAKRQMRHTNNKVRIEENFDIADSQIDPLSSLIWKSQQGHLDKILSELDDEHEFILRLRIIEDLTPMEIASIVEKDVKTVRNILYYEYEYIKKCFRDLERGEDGEGNQ